MENTITAENPGLIFNYAGFWPRLGALILDVCIILPVAFPITYFNVTNWKSLSLMIALSLVTMAYKPFFEFTFGATPGKMALDLRVVNLNHLKANLKEVLLRNIFHLASGFLSLLTALVTFQLPEFQEISGFMEYSQLTGLSIFSSLQSLSSLIFLADVIYLVADKRCRSLHDRIGQTYVIRTS